jgi:Zn-finger nucleic acid-binding protein
MPACPICAKPLDTRRQREGLFYWCPDCNGRALTIPQIRRVCSDRLAAKLLRLIKLSRRQGERPCPFCARPMVVVQSQEPLLELDACRPCSVVWFDAPTYETLPEGTVETTSSLAMQATEIVAMNRLRELKAREREREEEERNKKKKKKKRGAGATAIDPHS